MRIGCGKLGINVEHRPEKYSFEHLRVSLGEAVLNMRQLHWLSIHGLKHFYIVDFVMCGFWHAQGLRHLQVT